MLLINKAKIKSIIKSDDSKIRKQYETRIKELENQLTSGNVNDSI